MLPAALAPLATLEKHDAIEPPGGPMIASEGRLSIGKVLTTS
jgi:hypothetical protein